MSDAIFTPSRRSVLAAAGLAATTGCVRRVRSALDRETPRQLSLSVKTLPADADPAATRLARVLTENLRQVGINATLVPMELEELYRDVLLNQSFDLYIGTFPAFDDPDVLRLLLHSQFAVEPGWQNPFGVSDLSLDELLETQAMQSGRDRKQTLAAIQRRVARDQPFTVIAFPDEIRATRATSFLGWNPQWTGSTTDFLQLTPAELATSPSIPPAISESDAIATETNREPPADASTTTTQTTDTESAPEATATTTPTADSDMVTARMTIVDPRPTRNRNPLAVEFRGGIPLTDLVYDSLAKRVDGSLLPWAAESWSWETADSTMPTVTLTLRSGQTWHDGEPLTAEDVVFTYEFLADTSLGEFSTPVPAPVYRAESSLVSGVRALDGETVELEFAHASPEVAVNALTVPLLPEHIWEETARRASVAGIDTGRQVTEALVWGNPNPVGSGPFAFADATVDTFLSFTPFEDHFLAREDEDGPFEPFLNAFTFDRVRFDYVPSSAACVELLTLDRADATASPLAPQTARDIGRAEDLDFYVTPSTGFYHLGFNVRTAPLSDPRFRRAVASLLDKQHLVGSVFGGYATPATSPLDGTNFVPSDLEWDGEDAELPFVGSNGELNVERARQRFKDAGYRYTEGGKLVYG
ncbi:ABC transporter substrate-binding protein [Haloferax namakaokahaiae]|uniref:ABC transporter substrate-binding protein n=1 Tax=Haloferax namakaokahaiae TaxID=1748331 RepID=A0ABD5ZIZ8_9EURY